jgi:hypothetical protein
VRSCVLIRRTDGVESRIRKAGNHRQEELTFVTGVFLHACATRGTYEQHRPNRRTRVYKDRYGMSIVILRALSYMDPPATPRDS